MMKLGFSSTSRDVRPLSTTTNSSSRAFFAALTVAMVVVNPTLAAKKSPPTAVAPASEEASTVVIAVTALSVAKKPKKKDRVKLERLHKDVVDVVKKSGPTRDLGQRDAVVVTKKKIDVASLMSGLTDPPTHVLVLAASGKAKKTVLSVEVVAVDDGKTVVKATLQPFGKDRKSWQTLLTKNVLEKIPPPPPKEAPPPPPEVEAPVVEEAPVVATVEPAPVPVPAPAVDDEGEGIGFWPWAAGATGLVTVGAAAAVAGGVMGFLAWNDSASFVDTDGADAALGTASIAKAATADVLYVVAAVFVVGAAALVTTGAVLSFTE